VSLSYDLKQNDGSHPCKILPLPDRVPVCKLFLLATLCLLPFIVQDEYFLHVAITIFLYVIYTSTYRFVLRTGQLHFGAHGFIGIGAYASALLVKESGMPFWLAMPVAGGISAVCAVLIGYPALRVKGVYFAIITWGFAEALRFLYMRVKYPFGGIAGVFGISRPESIPIPLIGTIEFTQKLPYYFLVLALVLLTLGILYRLEKSRFGLIFAAIREGDRLAESIGVNIMNYKVLAFAICSGLAGIGGSFYAHYTYFISPNDFNVLLTIHLALYVVIGGLNSFSGPILGTAILLLAGEFFAGFGFYRMMLFSGLTIFVLLALPEGIVSLPRMTLSAFSRFGKNKGVVSGHESA